MNVGYRDVTVAQSRLNIYRTFTKRSDTLVTFAGVNETRAVRQHKDGNGRETFSGRRCIATLQQGRGSNNIWNAQAGVCFYFRRDVSPSNNTYFDVLRIVQHLINPHVAAPLSKATRSETEMTRSFAVVLLTLRSGAGFKSFKDVMVEKISGETSEINRMCLNNRRLLSPLNG